MNVVTPIGLKEHDTWSLKQTGVAYRRVIVAHRQWAVRQAIATALSYEGIDVSEAVDGDDLVRVFKTLLYAHWPSEPVDLIVTHDDLGPISGLDVVEALHDAAWHVPCLLLTNQGRMVAQATAMGVMSMDSPYPFNPAAIWRRARGLLNVVS